MDRDRNAARNVATGDEFVCRARVGLDEENSLRSIGDPVAPDSTRIVEPFNHPRVLVDDYDVAEQLLRFVIGKMVQSETFATSPLVVLHADVVSRAACRRSRRARCERWRLTRARSESSCTKANL